MKDPYLIPQERPVLGTLIANALLGLKRAQDLLDTDWAESFYLALEAANALERGLEAWFHSGIPMDATDERDASE